MNVEEVRRFIRFCIVGVVSTATHVGTLTVLVEMFGWNAKLASTLGFIYAVVASFFLNSSWTFAASEAKKSVYFLKYAAVCTIGLGINSILMYVFIDLLHIWYLMSQLLTIVFVTPSNFLLNRFWAFKTSGNEVSENA